MKPYLLATAATLILSAPALAGGQNQATGAAGSAQQTQYQNQQPGMGQAEMDQGGMNQAAQNISPDRLSEQEIKDLQQALNREGFDSGNVDGIWGPETRAAVSNFQERQNIAGNGELNHETLSALGVQFAQQDQIDQNGIGTTGAGTTGAGSPDADEPAVDTSPAPAEQPGATGTQQ
jgi:peptidoglycan hydrolase-like protein with peptidoglycan-binding domain